MFLLVVYISLALGASFLCSVLEAVLLSVTPSYVAKIEEQNPKAGERLRHLKVDIDKPLAAILSLNTVAHTIGAAGAGAQAQVVFGQEWVSIMSAILTLLILIVSEIVPKTLGTTYARQLAGFTGASLHLLVKGLRPVVALLEAMTRMLRPSEEEPAVTRSELAAMVRLSAEGGGLEPGEGRIVDNLLELQAVRVSDVMTPRTILLALPGATSVGQVLDDGVELSFTRIPVFGRDIDDVLGYVLRHEVLERAAAGQRELPLSELVRPLPELPRGASVATALERFIAEKEHICLVVDEFGGTVGVVTLEDALETLLGREIVDESDPAADMAALARRRFARLRERREALQAARETARETAREEAGSRQASDGGQGAPGTPPAGG